MYLIGSGALCALAVAACIIRNRATQNVAAMPRFYRIHTGLFRKYVFSPDHNAAASDETVRTSLNLGIFVVMGVTTCVLAGFLRFIISIARRSRAGLQAGLRI